MKTPRLIPVLLAGLLAASALVAYDAGGFAFTKRAETKLLAEPKPLAETTGKLDYGRKVKVDEVKGAWVRVSEGDVAGWVFGGNLSATKPAESVGMDGLAVMASKTTATAAARPLEEATVKYSEQENLGDALSDLQWMNEAAATVTAEDVDQYLQQNKKGEYQ